MLESKRNSWIPTIPPNPQLLYGLGKKSHRTPLIVLMFLSKNMISGNIKNMKKLQKEKARNHFGRW